MRYPGKMKFAGLIFALFLAFQLGNSVTYAQISPTETPQPSCVNGQGWIHGTLGVRQGKQLNGLPLPLSRSDTSFAYGPPDSTFYSLGRGGWVSFSFPAEVSNISGDEVMIYEETFGRSTYPMESAKVYVSDDGVTWKIIGKIATSRINALGITSINIGETGLSQIRYIKLQDIISRDNFYPESDGFDVNAIGAKSVVCPEPSPTPTPTLTLTPTLTITPSLTPTMTPTPTPVSLTVDFSTTVSTGSPLVFGGSHSPRSEQTDAWDKIQAVGVTAIRHDFNPDRVLPPNITLDDYRNNVNNVQDPANWSQDQINYINNILTEAGNRGMKRIAIMAYVPRWLSSCNCIFGVPSDFNVYKDIVKKIYRLHRDKVDYIEIWNEPTHPTFLNVTGTSFTVEQAYIQIFNTAALGIREVDTEINDGKHAVIGGLVADAPDRTTMLQAMMNDPTLKTNLDFISYHAYDKITEPSWVKYKPILAGAGLPNLPIYITEWNYYFNDVNPTPFNGGPESVSYTGRKFIEYLKMGLQIANYHTLEPINTSRPNNGTGTYGFYRWDATTSTATLLEQSKTWRLMSKTLELGNGASAIYASPTTNTLPIIGFTNVSGKKGIVFSNEMNMTRQVTVETDNISGVTQAKVYGASQSSDGSGVLNTVGPQPVGPNLIWRLTVPPLSVTALLLE
jgi:hypothetical protein